MTSVGSWELRAETNARHGKAGGERTIVVVGDSIAFGWPLRYHDSYPAQLERMLGDCGGPLRWQVINAGVPGNTVLLGAERYDRDVQSFWPSIVLIQFGLNDGALRRTRFDAQRERVWRAQRSKRTRLTVAFGGLIRRWGKLNGESGRVVHRPTPRVSEPVFADALGDLVRRTRAMGATPWLLSLIPLSPELLSANQWRTYHRYDQAIRNVAAATDSAFVDLRSDAGTPFDADVMLADDGIQGRATLGWPRDCPINSCPRSQRNQMNPIKQIQRNHALEHATVHILSHLQPGLRLVGRTDHQGFWLYGSVSTTVVRQAIEEGLARLQNNESWLAVHPKCGTNIAVAALVGSAALRATQALAPDSGGAPENRRAKASSLLGRAAVAAIALGGALALAQPLGLLAQRHVTTAPDLDGVSLRDIVRQEAGGLVIHRVFLAHDS